MDYSMSVIIGRAFGASVARCFHGMGAVEDMPQRGVVSFVDV